MGGTDCQGAGRARRSAESVARFRAREPSAISSNKKGHPENRDALSYLASYSVAATLPAVFPVSSVRLPASSAPVSASVGDAKAPAWLPLVEASVAVRVRRAAELSVALRAGSVASQDALVPDDSPQAGYCWVGPQADGRCGLAVPPDDSFADEPQEQDFAASDDSAAAARRAGDYCSPAAQDGWRVDDCPLDDCLVGVAPGDSAAQWAAGSLVPDSPDVDLDSADSDWPDLDSADSVLADWDLPDLDSAGSVLADWVAAGLADDWPADWQLAQVVPVVRHSVDWDARPWQWPVCPEVLASPLGVRRRYRLQAGCFASLAARSADQDAQPKLAAVWQRVPAVVVAFSWRSPAGFGLPRGAPIRDQRWKPSLRARSLVSERPRPLR